MVGWGTREKKSNLIGRRHRGKNSLRRRFWNLNETNGYKIKISFLQKVKEILKEMLETSGRNGRTENMGPSSG